MSDQFSIDIKLCAKHVSTLDNELEKIQDQITDIYRRAVIGEGYSPAQMVTEQMGATPTELNMLSKVFARLAVLTAQREDLRTKRSALMFIKTKDEWIYDKIGAPSPDVDVFLATFTDTETIEP